MTEIPKRIGKYELEEFLGGGMSRVYRARDTVIGRTVAVKILTEEASADPEAKARFLREAQVAGALAHENVMSVYDFGEEAGQPFMVMEFLRGEDLRSAMKGGRTGDLTARLRTAIQIAKALEYIHSQKIIHRDIKPENIHINETGAVKLMDFGIAKSEELSLTRPGFTLGTPYYMAPEQVTGRDVTQLADVYAFGILLYELLSGQRPIAGDNVEQLFARILHEQVDLAPLDAAGVPGPVVRLIGRSVAKSAAQRPQSFAEVRRELEQAIAPPEPPAPAPGRRWMLPALAAVVLAVALVLYFALRPRAAAPPPPEKPAELSPLLSLPSGDMVLAGGSFYIDRTEVTNRAYADFCLARQRPFPPGFPKDKPDYPVVNITIVDAREFARWAGKRLPAKNEWEHAARGDDGRAYPWGNTKDPSFANVADNSSLGSHELMPAGAFPQGASPYGALQMAGNVWEFVDELITPSAGALQRFARYLQPPPTADEPWYSMSGGAYDIPLVENVTTEWTAVPARYREANIGFRCARDAR
ncbi:MAG: protein kinase [Bryobacterales bacterium]|nr:protein kinase [Bryobacterales bacterium]